MFIEDLNIVGNKGRIFRDDIYPFLGGGNKGRKIKYIESHIIENGYNAVVTTGGIQSNHCRALAVLSAKKKWKCTLVLHGDKKKFYLSRGNAELMRLSGAEIIFVSPSDIGEKMDQSIDAYKAAGYKPYYVWGGGHTLEGGKAYIDAVKVVSDYSVNNNWTPDYIFLASGTGSTQAGILAGLDKTKINANVIGISVARNQVRAEEVVSKFYDKLIEVNQICKIPRRIIVLDEYLCGGYEKYNAEIENISKNSLSDYGFLLDTTYSGKAFYGMLEFLKKNNITDKNILFWHTGGVFNYLS